MPLDDIKDMSLDDIELEKVNLDDCKQDINLILST